MLKTNPTLEVNAVSIVNGRITELGKLAPDGTPIWRLAALASCAAMRAGVAMVAVPGTGNAAEIYIAPYESGQDGEPVLRTVIDGHLKRVLHELPRLPTLH